MPFHHGYNILQFVKKCNGYFSKKNSRPGKTGRMRKAGKLKNNLVNWAVLSQTSQTGGTGKTGWTGQIKEGKSL
jgi:hypothetical protein